MAKPYDQPHLFVQKAPTVQGFTSISAGGGRTKRKSQDRAAHGTKLQAEYEKAVAEPEDSPRPIRVEFQSEPGFDLKLKSLDSSKDGGIELLSVRQAGDVTFATVLIPREQLKHFRKIFERYIKENFIKDGVDTGTPRHAALVDSIATVRRAALKSVWTELDAPPPPVNHEAWFEIWLRRKGTTVEAFRGAATQLGLRTIASEIQFIDRTVTLVGATTAKLELLLEEDPAIAEVRLARALASEFTEMDGQEQVAWMKDLAARIAAPAGSAPAVCLLDTGVNRGHELLKPALNETDLHTYDPAWKVDDHHGHGTELAGTALYGDLAWHLERKETIALTHRLESVKILPPNGENDQRLWGAITAEAVARAEVAAADRPRTVCLAVTSTAASDRGRPSSWSAAIDKLAAGYDDDDPKLICVSAGNVDLDDYVSYPASNESQGIYDPGQAWNAVTVGAVADRATISEKMFKGWTPVAAHGDLGPSSSTSQPWNNKATWPLKPEILMPGGNAALDPSGKQIDTPDSLGILTTHRDVVRRQFSVTRDTSAATALAARLAARLQAAYTKLWPETIRALMIHSAEWTPQMLERYPGSQRGEVEQRLRCCGYGVPREHVAFASAMNDATVIIEQKLQPFDERLEDGVRTYVTRDLHLHALPWPESVLRSHGAAEIELRVTLSYFVEPSPGDRGGESSYRYGSHGLRFDLKTPTESVDQFQRRINKQARAPGEKATSKSDATEWTLGPDLRAKGSVHSDWWHGTAAQLADKGTLAVYPSIGWWRERHHLGRWNAHSRYALIISIRAPRLDVDVYTPIKNLIAVPVTIPSR